VKRLCSGLARALAPLAFIALLVALWQGLSSARLISPVFFPAPTRVWAEWWLQVSEGTLWEPLFETGTRMALGWLLASLAGIVLGALVGSSRRARDFLMPLLEFMRPLPASAIIPVAILFLGLSDRMAIAVIAFGAVWPVLLATVHGFVTVEPQLVELARTLCLPPRVVLRVVAIPSAVPDIVAGMRVSLAIALILAVVTEMQAAQTGLGQNILLAQRSYRSAELYAGIVTLGLLGYALNLVLERVEARLLRWRRPHARHQ
jgi:ABC-type nitrate/sulfonate/bicarbonate transport system permease component